MKFFNSNLCAKKTQTGRSMIEMLGVLAIMAVITVLSIMAYTMAMKSVKINKLKSDIYTIAQQVNSICPNKDYGNCVKIGLSLQSKIDAFNNTFVTTGLLKDNSTPFKGKTKYILSYTSPSDKLAVLVVGMNPEECSLILSQDWNINGMNGGEAIENAGVGQTTCAYADPNNMNLYIAFFFD